MTATTATSRSVTAAAPTTREDLHDLPTCDVFHHERPNAAGFLNISKDLAYSLARSGELPTKRLGRRLVVPVSKLLAWIDA